MRAHMRDDFTAENLDKGMEHFGTLTQSIWVLEVGE